jgi:hypothetical protein
LLMACAVCAAVPPGTITPSRAPSWPETTSQGPASTIGEYGPTGGELTVTGVRSGRLLAGGTS